MRRRGQDLDTQDAPRPDSPHLWHGALFGKDVQSNAGQIIPHVGSVIGSPGFLPHLTAAENLEHFAPSLGASKATAPRNALELVGLPYSEKKPLSEYSNGAKRRLTLALAILHDPELLILDEPASGLTPAEATELLACIRDLCDRQGKTILVSSHSLTETFRLADVIGIIDHGTLFGEENVEVLGERISEHISSTISNVLQFIAQNERRGN